LNKEKPLNERSPSELYDLVIEEVVEPKISKTWNLYYSLFHKNEMKIM